jgi:AcrR family transcriptional regulator
MAERYSPRHRPDRPSGGVRAPDETRARILHAAAEQYAQHGYHGCTTRAVATAAGVNEVTVFRLFGSKDAMIDAAIERSAEDQGPSSLPSPPAHPHEEISAWCAIEMERLRRGRALLRRCFAEAEEHPAHVKRATLAMDPMAMELRRYVAQLDHRGSSGDQARHATAIAMLLSTLFADALGREDMPFVFSSPVARAPAEYAAMFLDALGVSG